MRLRNSLGLLDVYARLAAACRDAGGQKAWAMRHGISASYVSDVMQGKSDPGASILKPLGLERVVRYVEKRIADA